MKCYSPKVILLGILLEQLGCLTASSGVAATERRGQVIKMMQQMEDDRWHQMDASHEESPPADDCSESQWSDEPNTASMDSIIELNDGADILSSSKGNLIMVEKNDLPQVLEQSVSELERGPAHSEQQDDGCPMGQVSDNILEPGLHYGKSVPQSNQQEPKTMRQMDFEPVMVMIAPPAVPYTKSALAAKHQHLAAKFPFKSPKLTSAKQNSEDHLMLSALGDGNKFEQQKTWLVGQQPVQTSSLILSQSDLKSEPEQQPPQTVSSVISQPVANWTASNNTPTDLASGLFGDGFEPEPEPKPRDLVGGQRARDTFLMASNVARSLKMRDKNKLKGTPTQFVVSNSL